ncbi:MAG: sodium-translocating pyrophosphatase [Candidatus Riflebacteria bacterium]|nr:sodium-translocating pyrophosphatase [Candidatus Riflebacteria bacterium]
MTSDSAPNVPESNQVTPPVEGATVIPLPNVAGTKEAVPIETVLNKPASEAGFSYFEFYYSPKYSTGERYALLIVVFVALSGLLYAYFLMCQVRQAETGTAKMQAVAEAVREGAIAYLKRQLTIVGLLIFLLVIVLFLAKAMTSSMGFRDPFAWGRAGAFLLGALFSGTVGYVGMSLATLGNLRVAAAATVGFGKALILGYRTGTITGMLTDGLGLLGGTLIFMIYGEHAYEALLGFGFGGTLLALFMRVGGGIYTKAADVGADLVGKIEKDIPEDDPRNAATIADNVGDNVGDCAGMAADIFESYEVTIVAAMILGYVAFGHKGVMFPILVRAIGVFASIISTYLVRAGDKGHVADAMSSINIGFYAGSVISVFGFILLGAFYLYFAPDPMRPWLSQVPHWANFNMLTRDGWVLDMRPAYTCLIGIILCVVLNRVTEYYTGTEFSPVKEMVKTCTTGHATNIIEGFALGCESAVATAIVLSVAIFSSVIVYSGTNAICIAYGVAMCGIGMLTMTGNTISMDVFGPVADNANGIGEMGYDEKEMGAEKYKEARQVLSDLDAVGNTTKAVTKGVAIGSAVIAAVSLFASFITVIGSGGGGETKVLPMGMFDKVAALLTISNPSLLIGMLLGGSVPLLFSSMTIRAVGRAAFLIVNECRMQFHRPGVMEGTVKPEYGRVVNICTAAAQKELVGPALLAVFSPILVGFLLGPVALAGFLGGSIVVGQLFASLMCNAGGAWDNAKKMVEDEPRDAVKNTGKGSEKHKASVTGDTVGDPLKDTAGPAINPLLKVMNMVSILAVPLLLGYDRHVVDSVKRFAVEEKYLLNPTFGFKEHDGFWFLAVFIAAMSLIWSHWQSKREVKREFDTK